MNKDRIAELKEEIKELRKKDWLEGEFGYMDKHDEVSRRISAIWEREAELLGRQEQEKEDNRKFVEWLEELTKCGVSGDARRLVERKIRELEGEDK